MITSNGFLEILLKNLSWDHSFVNDNEVKTHKNFDWGIISFVPLLAFTANSAAQSSAQTHIHSAIVVIDTSNNAWHSQVHWLAGTPHLAVKASNEARNFKLHFHILFFSANS